MLVRRGGEDAAAGAMAAVAAAETAASGAVNGLAPALEPWAPARTVTPLRGRGENNGAVSTEAPWIGDLGSSRIP